MKSSNDISNRRTVNYCVYEYRIACIDDKTMGAPRCSRESYEADTRADLSIVCKRYCEPRALSILNTTQTSPSKFLTAVKAQV
jgi:hypothetical protein